MFSTEFKTICFRNLFAVVRLRRRIAVENTVQYETRSRNDRCPSKLGKKIA